MDVLYNFGCEFDPVVFDVSVAAFVAPFDSISFFDFIVIMQAHDELSDDDIETGTEATASHNASFRLGWFVKDFFAWACLNELNGLSDVFVVGVFLVSSHKQVVSSEIVFWDGSRTTEDRFADVLTHKRTLKELPLVTTRLTLFSKMVATGKSFV